jgi:phosphohistidine phosphatase
MEVLVVRHAIAADRGTLATPAEDDRERPLTEKGRKRMKSIAQGLARCGPTLDTLATSPLRRAVETAAILAGICETPDPEVLTVLEPEGALEGVLAWLRERQRDQALALVGHEPQLGLLASWLVCGRRRAFIELKKGGACLLHFDGKPDPGRAILRWALTPAQLRRIGR